MVIDGSGAQVRSVWDRGTRLVLGIVAAMALLALAFAALGASPAGAHAGHDHHDGRLHNQPDFKQVGKTTYRFKPGLEEYEIRTPGEPTATAHVDYKPEGVFSPGGHVALPAQELAPVCRTAGNRIVVVYSHRSSDATPTPTESLRSIVRRMNWKINQQGSLSSGGGRSVQMAVDCTAGGTIQVYDVTSANNNIATISGVVKSQFGDPSGVNAVKYLVFDHEKNAEASGIGDLYRDETKSFANYSAVSTGVAISYDGSWATHVPIHELFHNLGAVQKLAPYANTAHCIDGIDVLCYSDGPSTWGTYGETRCPASSGYEGAEKTPLDCGYDTYFNAAPGAGNYLAGHWNAGGQEDLFLINPADPLLIARSETIRQQGTGEVTLRGTVLAGGALSTTYRFEYGSTTSYGSATSSTSIANSPGGKAVEATIGGLTPGSTYHYRVSATNANGTVYSDDSSFKASLWSADSVSAASSFDYLEGVSCPSRSDCTAVGRATSKTLVNRWNGQAWSTETSPSPAGASLSVLRDVSCGSGFCMAVGQSESGGFGAQPLALYRSGGSWSEVAVPSPAGPEKSAQLNAVSCVSATACIAVGQDQSQTLAASWDGSKWTLLSPVNPAGGSGLRDVSCTAANACTAVGYASGGLIERWNGSEWALQTPASASVSGKELNGISCWSASGCVAVGAGNQFLPLLAESWNGSKWQLDSTPGDKDIAAPSVSCQASGACVAVGSGLAVVREGGTWTTDPIGYIPGAERAIQDVSCWSASSCGSVGYRYEPGKAVGLAQHRAPFVAPSAETTTAGSVKGLTATLNGGVDPNGYATTYQFEYGPTTAYGSKVPASPKAVGTGTGEVQVAEAIAGLKPLSTYHYRVVATSAAGQTFGKDTTLSTTTDAPSATAEAASGVTVTKASLNASVNPDGLETTYQFEYGKTTSYGSKAPAAAKAIGSGTSAVKVAEAIAGLSGGTTYHYRVVATNSAGTVNSADATLTTSPTQSRVYSLSFGKSGNGNGQFSYPRGVAVDASGNVYVTDLMHGYVQKFNSKGEYLSKTTIPGAAGFGYMQGLAVDSKGNLWISDNEDSSIRKYSPKGEQLLEIESYYPAVDIAVDSKDGIWIAEPQGHQLDHYNAAGEQLASLGGIGPGSGAGKFNEPSYLALDAEDNLWVAERGNKRVQKFNSKGEYLSQFGSAGTSDGKFQDPSGIDVGPDGTIWVSDMDTNRIQAFSPAGVYLAKFGAGGTGAGQFGEYHLPSSNLAAGPDGSVWVVDPSNQRVQKWIPSE